MRAQISIVKTPINWHQVVCRERQRKDFTKWCAGAFALFLISAGMLSYSVWYGYNREARIYEAPAAFPAASILP